MSATPRLIECVPNFSEGSDMALIGRLTDAIEAVDGVRLLDVDPGKATNRTVVTFAGSPEAVLDAAVACVTLAAELITPEQVNFMTRFGRGPIVIEVGERGAAPQPERLVDHAQPVDGFLRASPPEAGVERNGIHHVGPCLEAVARAGGRN